jgi:hypothetical protein
MNYVTNFCFLFYDETERKRAFTAFIKLLIFLFYADVQETRDALPQKKEFNSVMNV